MAKNIILNKDDLANSFYQPRNLDDMYRMVDKLCDFGMRLCDLYERQDERLSMLADMIRRRE